jgi:hypothetical protein
MLLLTDAAMASDDDESANEGFEILESCQRAQVMIGKRARKEFDRFEVKPRARLKEVMKRWCNGVALTSEMMNTNEGRTSKHKEMVQAFKAFKNRLYGFEKTENGIRTFRIVDADPAKKQNKAGPILDRAKKRVDVVIDGIIKREEKQ